MSRILLADDDQDILDLNAIFIESMTGIKPEIVICPDGQTAIDVLRESARKKFDVILTDFQMGEGPDGVDVVNEAVRLHMANPHVPNVFVSTCYGFKSSDTAEAKRLQGAARLPGVRVMDKMGIDDIERHIIPVLKRAG